MSRSRNGGVTASASLSRTGQRPQTTTQTEALPPLRSDAPVSEVEVAMGKTVNLGNYNSFRVDVHVRIPVNRGEEEEGIKYAEKLADAHAERIAQENRFS